MMLVFVARFGFLVLNLYVFRGLMFSGCWDFDFDGVPGFVYWMIC